MPNCKKCNAAIKFIPMATGGVMPVDAAPLKIALDPLSKDTFIEEIYKPRGKPPVGVVTRGRVDPNGSITAYISHFVTCPYAGHFKKTEVRNEH